MYNIYEQNLNLFSANKTRISDDVISFKDLSDKQLDEIIEDDADKLRHDIELIEGVYDTFDVNRYLSGEVAPVFFGSAINNFGVKELLDAFIKISPNPVGRESTVRFVKPEEEKFTGFVFKIHANLDPKHRDRIAFLRIVSGKFERNKFYKHVRLQKELRFSNPTSFMAQDKSVIDEAFPGDVVGLYDAGNFKIGDTLTEGEDMFYKGIPSFSPEIFRELINKDPMKSKQLEKGIEQLTDEGVAQLFYLQPGNRKIVGVVGELQFDVIQYRLEHEYKAACLFQSMPFYKACWLTSKDKTKLDEFVHRKAQNIGWDKDENPVFLAPSQWLLNTARQDYPDVVFHTTSDFKEVVT